MPKIKKFYLLLLVLCAFSALLLSVVFNRGKNIQTKTANAPLVSEGYMDLDLSTTGLTPIGNPGASTIAVGWFDFNETRDREILKNLLTAVEEHPQDLQLYIKNLPQQHLFFNRDTALPGRALWCAIGQNQYRAFLEKGVLAENELTAEFLQQTATDIGLNQTTWQNCLNSPTANQMILDDFEQAEKIGIRSTPTLFINNKQINLEEGVDVKELLDKLLTI